MSKINRWKYKITEDVFTDAVKSSFSLAQVLRVLGIKPAGGNYQTIRHRIKTSKVDTSHFTGKMWSKGKKIGPQRPIEDYLIEGKLISTNFLRLRLLKEGIFEKICSSCGLDSWMNAPIPIELDHINGDKYNNTLENLRILCPNCHALTDTYKGKNRKFGKSNPVEKQIKIPKITIPKVPKVKKEYYCFCGKIISQNSINCLEHRVETARKFDPTKEELEKLVWEMSTVKVAKQFNVSDKAVEKRCKLLGIEKPPRGYWAKVAAGKI